MLNLSQKMVILVAVPLAFEIAIFSTLGLLLREAERQAAVEQHSMNVVTEVNSIQRNFINSARNLAAYAISKKMGIPAQQFGFTDPRDGSLERLKSLTDGDPEQRADVEKIAAIFNSVQDVLAESKRSIDDGIYEGGLLHARLLHQELNSVGVEFQQLTRRIVARERRRGVAVPRTSAQTKQIINSVLTAALPLSFLIAAALTVYFYKGTNRRLSMLVDNTNRMSRGVPLNPTISGSDEIALLDQSFHSMARTIDAAMKKERAIIENMPVGIVIIDDDGLMRIMNPKTERMFDYALEDVAGKPFSILFGEDKNPIGFMANLRERALHRVIESKAIKKNGDAFPVDLSLSQFGDVSEKLWLASISDASDRHEIERMKGELVSIVCHDLRTPLTSVQTNLWLLGEGAFGDLSTDAARVVGVSEKEVDRLITLVKDWLDIQVIEAGRLELQRKPINISIPVDQSIDAVQPYAGNAKVQIDAHGCDLLVYADTERLTQVLVNLLSNAVQYSTPGSAIRVSYKESDKYCRVTVTDNGPGIPIDKQEKIFERYKRESSGDNKRGAGLGLAISKEIVERHGGAIGVFSEVGVGSTFWFDIPLADQGQ